MMDSQFFDQLSKRISNLIPPGVQQLQGDVEKNVKALLQSAFKQLDFVTRDEFDAQTKVLNRTRERLQILEQKVADLELIRQNKDEE